MKRFILAAGVAALAITMPAVADPGEKGGKGRDRGAKVERSDKAAKQFEKRFEARRDMAEKHEKAREKAFKHAEKRAEKFEEKRFKAQEKFAKQQEKAFDRRAKMAEKEWERRDKQLEKIAERRAKAFEKREDRLEKLAERRGFRDRDWDDLPRRGVWVDACPPGLAKKDIACLPPGQAKKLVGQRLSSLRDRVELRDLPSQLRYAYNDTPDHYYRYGDGYVYRVNRSNDLVSALLPLFGLGYAAGQPFPSAYSGYGLPSAYQPFYPASGYDYRYANGYIYQIDPRTGLIADVDPMLGYGYGYGQMLPANYSAYNVPYEYRPLYYDTADSYYRYAPGAIYQVDPKTSLITAVAALLTNGLTVGQQLPAGYGAYNVPYDYRSQYYDTPDDWYRYANGNIYRVDPTTQLVTAIVTSILT